jgi:hypothetical protein
MRIKNLGLLLKDSYFETHFIHWTNILAVTPIKVLTLVIDSILL